MSIDLRRPINSPTPNDSTKEHPVVERPDATTELAWTTHAAEEEGDRKVLRGAMFFAVAMHLVLLLLTVPQSFTEPPSPEDEPRRVFVMEVQRFKPPPPPAEAPPPPPQRVREIPVPDPTPDDPEPIPEAPREMPEIELDTDVPLILPTAPPAPPAPPAPEIVRVGADVTAPERIHYVEPKYTEAARRARISGAVILELVIDEAGRVSDVQVLKSLPLGLTDEAVRAAEQWRFEPSTMDGRPVSVRYVLTVHYGLR